MLTSPASSRCGRTLSPTGTRRRVSRRDAVALAREESNSGDGNPDSCRLLDVVRQIGRVGYHRGEKHQRRGSARISRTPDGHLTFSLGKAKGWGESESLSVQVVPNDVLKLRSFADDLERKAFGEDRPSPEECDPEWHELSKRWFKGSPTVTAWITAALPDPDGDSDVVVTLWKKQKETERVAMRVESYAAENLRDLADLLDRASRSRKAERRYPLPTLYSDIGFIQVQATTASIFGVLTDSNGLCVPKTYIASVRNSLPAKYAGLRIGNRLSEASIADS